MNSKQVSIVLGVVVLLAVVGYMALRDNSQTDTLSQQNTTPNSNLADSSNNASQPLNNTNNQTQTSNNTNTQTSETKTTFRSDENGYHGTLTLTGYVEMKTIKDFDDQSFDYASFRFSKTDNELIHKFLEHYKDNSFVSSNSVGLGCYQKDKQRIYSMNSGDDGGVENIISGTNLQKLLSSSQSNQIKLTLTKPIFSGGSGAPACYSHFRLFQVQ